MKSIKKSVAVITVVAAVLGMSVFAFGAASSKNSKDKDVIKSGVRIESIDVSDLTEEEANTKVKVYVKEKTNVPVKIDVNGTEVKTNLSDLGYKWTNKSVIEEAVGVGKSGNVIKRYKDGLDLKNKGIELKLEFGIEEKNMKDNLKKICDSYNVEAKNASLKLTSSGFEVIPEQDGVVIDYDVTVSGLYDYITKEWDNKSDILYTAETKVSKPKYTSEDLKKVSSTPMGSYYTSFSVGTSYDNRNNNIKHGAEVLDGILLYPGEQYSLNEHLAPWTAENGWYPAGTYVDGGVADSYGGGICQVSSTLYNALLEAEIKVVERYSHSMSVAYVPLAADAALAGDYKDLVFENNTDAPIYIQSVYNAGGTLTFKVYGHDTRDSSRSVKYVSETVKEIPIGTKVTKDSSKPTSYESVTENGHVGYVAKLWKVTYENGEEVDKELLHTSTYAMTPRKVVRGTKKADKTTEEATKKKDDSDSDSDNKEETTKKNEKPGNTTEAKAKETKKSEE